MRTLCQHHQQSRIPKIKRLLTLPSHISLVCAIVMTKLASLANPSERNREWHIIIRRSHWDKKWREVAIAGLERDASGDGGRLSTAYRISMVCARTSYAVRGKQETRFYYIYLLQGARSSILRGARKSPSLTWKRLTRRQSACRGDGRAINLLPGVRRLYFVGAGDRNWRFQGARHTLFFAMKNIPNVVLLNL